MRKLYSLFVFLVVVLAFGCQDELQYEIDREAIRNYLAENNLEATPHPSGVYYNIIEPGGNVRPTNDQEVEVRYTGRLLADDSVFDATEGQETIQFFLFQVIQGWQIGIPLIGRGGEITLYIPSDLAYGGNAQRDQDGEVTIPANSPLIFEVELVDFE